MDDLIPLLAAVPLSEPLKKLIETIEMGVGGFFRPSQIRRVARAEADAKEILAKGDLRAEIVKAEGEEKLIDLRYRALMREDYLELRRQQNLESIISQAIKQLPEKVSDESVDPDWSVQFFDFCKDVSNEQMQLLWAQILAGEVTKPRSFSPRTLFTVKLLSKSDAEIFQNFCNYIAFSDGRWTHFCSPWTDDYLAKQGLGFDAFLHLETLGLISNSKVISIDLEPGENIEAEFVDGRKYIITNPADHKGIRKIFVRLPSSVGMELFLLCDIDLKDVYIRLLSDFWKDSGLSIEVRREEEE